MSGCGHDPMAVQALIDGELDALRAAEVEAQIAACAACQAEEARLLALRQVLRAPAARLAAPAALRQRLVASLSESPPAASRVVPFVRPPSRWAWAGGGAGAALAACAALFMAVGQFGQQAALADALVASHVRSLQGAHLIDVATSDQHVVKPWFDGRLDFSPPVVNLKVQGFPLIGGRLDYVGGRNVAAIVYGRGRHVINLYVWPAAGGGEGIRTEHGFTLRHWSGGGMSYWAVSDVNPGDLAQFESDVRARAPA